jgi:ketosteroid isomerase-like protein
MTRHILRKSAICASVLIGVLTSSLVARAEQNAGNDAAGPSGSRVVTDRSQADFIAISILVARFDDAVNRRDVDEFRGLWASDAIWEIGDPRPLRVEGRETIVQTWTQLLANAEWLFRGSFAGVVAIDGDKATGRWPCVETGTFRATSSTPSTGYDNRAIYEDQYVKREGRWYFAHRKYVYLWLSYEKLPGGPVKLTGELL